MLEMFGPAFAGFSSGLVGKGMDFGLNMASAKQAQDFAKYMYKHRYQFMVEDLRKANLNPMLAYATSPGGSPGGSSFSMSGGIGDPVSSALSYQMNKAQRDLLAKQSTLTENQNAKVSAEADVARQEADMAAVRRTRIHDIVSAEIDALRAGAESATSSAKKADADRAILSQEFEKGRTGTAFGHLIGIITEAVTQELKDAARSGAR